MKKFLLIITCCISAHLYCQEPNPQLFNRWYLHELTVSEEVFLPTEYGFYPEIILESTNPALNFISFADAQHISCSSDVLFSETQPEEILSVNSPGICFPKATCHDGPQGDCSVMYNTHAAFFWDTPEEPITYQITNINDNTATLVFSKTNGNIARYGSEQLLNVENFNISEMEVFPNPVTNQLFVNSGTTTLAYISIYSLTGKLIYSVKNTQQINMTNLPNGLYLIELGANGMKAFKKVVKN